MSSPASQILIADQSRFFLTIERQFLRNTPATLLEARASDEVLAVCRAQRPQLIYLAYDLAEASGAECCRRLKADPELREGAVIVVCDEKADGQAAEARAAGCDAVLFKPLDRVRFLEVGRSFLAGIRERRRPCRIKVLVTSPARSYQTRGLDISSSGVFLETSEHFSAGDMLKLELHLATDDQPGPRIHCDGTVSWFNCPDDPRKPSHPIGYGIKFSGLSTQAAAILNGFLRILDSR